MTTMHDIAIRSLIEQHPTLETRQFISAVRNAVGRVWACCSMAEERDLVGLAEEQSDEIERLQTAARRLLDHLEPQYEPSGDENAPPELDRYVCHPFAVAEFSGALSGSHLASF